MIRENETLVSRYRSVRDQITIAADQVDRSPDSVTIVAVSKRQSAAAIREMAALGATDFGESYVAEGCEKVRALSDLDLRWHFIGPIQSNKTADIAAHFHWVHSLDRPRIVTRIGTQRPAAMPPVNGLVQINIGGEKQKSGIAPDALDDMIEHILRQDRIRLRGLMCIPPQGEPAAPYFQELQALFDAQRNLGDDWDTLSMGMTADFPDAIAAGATMVRIGTALFGPRP